MNASKRNRLNAAQNHVPGSAYVAGECTDIAHGQPRIMAEGHSQRGPPSLYTLADITARNISKSHVYNLMARGQFPKPVLVLGPRFTRWSAEQCDEWFRNPSVWIDAHASGAKAVPT